MVIPYGRELEIEPRIEGYILFRKQRISAWCNIFSDSAEERLKKKAAKLEKKLGLEMCVLMLCGEHPNLVPIRDIYAQGIFYMYKKLD